ncbi:hypothetical protein PMIN02_010296 [Paraphaeosphaeria minitans]
MVWFREQASDRIVESNFAKMSFISLTAKNRPGLRKMSVRSTGISTPITYHACFPLLKRRYFVCVDYLIFGHFLRFLFHAAQPQTIKSVCVNIKLLATVKMQHWCRKNSIRNDGAVFEEDSF